jgi:hypothetical protein
MISPLSHCGGGGGGGRGLEDPGPTLAGRPEAQKGIILKNSEK